MPGLFFFAASHTLKAHAHVAVDIVHNYVGRRTRYVLETLVSALATPVFALRTVVSAQQTYDDIRDRRDIDQRPGAADLDDQPDAAASASAC